MTFIENLFGRKRPTATGARAELAKVEAELAAAPARVAAAEAVLKRVADMTDDEHADAEELLAAARRAPIRLQAQADQLRGVLASAEQAESAAALKARAAAATKAMNDMERLLDRFDEQAAELRITATEVDKIDAEVTAVNREIAAARKAGRDAPEPVKGSGELFRCEPDHVEPDRVEHRTVYDGASVYEEVNGRMVPVGPHGDPRQVETVIPGRVRRGRSLPPPTHELCLPATRLGRKPAWPAAE